MRIENIVVRGTLKHGKCVSIDEFWKGSSLSNLMRVAEQTAFLLEKNKEAQERSNGMFTELLSVIDTKIEAAQKAGKKAEIEKLESVADFLINKQEEFDAEVQDDIDYLEAQLKEINTTLSLSDPAAEDTLYKTLMDGEELLSNEAFKTQLSAEAEESFAGFKAILEDIREALEEERLDEVLSWIDRMSDEDTDLWSDDEDEEEDDEYEDDQDDEEDEDEHSSSKIQDACCEDDEEEDCCGGMFDCKDQCVCDEACGCS